MIYIHTAVFVTWSKLNMFGTIAQLQLKSCCMLSCCNFKTIAYVWQDAVGDGRLRPWRRPFAPLCENVTSSTKAEVGIILHCRQRRIEPRSPQVTCRPYRKLGETSVKFGVVFEISERADRQTDINMPTYIQGRRHVNRYTKNMLHIGISLLW